MISNILNGLRFSFLSPSLRAQHRFGGMRDECNSEGGIRVDRTLMERFGMKIFWWEQDLLILTERVWDKIYIDGSLQFLQI